VQLNCEQNILHRTSTRHKTSTYKEQSKSDIYC